MGNDLLQNGNLTDVQNTIERADHITRLKDLVEALDFMVTNTLSNDTPDTFGYLVVGMQTTLNQWNDKFLEMDQRNKFTPAEVRQWDRLTKQAVQLFAAARTRALNFQQASAQFKKL